MLRSRDQRDLETTFGLGLGLTAIVLVHCLGLMKYWSRSHTFWSRGLKSTVC